jgi:hypothetical protein
MLAGLVGDAAGQLLGKPLEGSLGFCTPKSGALCCLYILWLVGGKDLFPRKGREDGEVVLSQLVRIPRPRMMPLALVQCNEG